jgi:hypothetical protein
VIDLHLLAYDWRLALVVVNWLLCSMVGWACLCRFSAMSRRTTRRRFRVAYVCVFMAATLSGFSWLWFGEWPGPGQISMAAAWLALLGVNAGNWANGPPDYAKSAPGAFDDLPHHHWGSIVGRGKDHP